MTNTSARDELIGTIHDTTTAWVAPVSGMAAGALADAILAAGYIKADHVEYALGHKRSSVQFADDDGELWTDEDAIKEYADEYGASAPIIQRLVTIWEPAA